MGRAKQEPESLAPAATLIPILLNECQHSQACHSRAIRQLVVCRRNNMEDFLEVWIRCLRPVFLVSKREPAVERIVDFIASFTAYWEEEHFQHCETFFQLFLSTLLDWTEASHRAVRFRACQVISAVVSKLKGDCIEVKDEMWDRMTLSMRTRMQDKQTSVRAFAASALSRLVLDDDIENSITVTAYRKALASDISPEVRKMVVKSMPCDQATLSDFVERIADISDAVRKATYQTIGEKFNVNTWSITQRAMTLERGLAERVPAVREECGKLLELWLRRDCDDDPLVLLHCLDVETNEKVGETAMLELLSRSLIKLSDTGLRKFLDSSENKQVRMSVEEALFWRVVCAHIHSEAKAKGCDAASTGGAEATVNAAAAAALNEYLENILPATVSDFVQLVDNHLRKGSFACFFEARQLLLIAKQMDFTDSTSRKNAGVLLQRLLRETAPWEKQSDSTDLDSQEWVGDGLSLGGDESWAHAVAEFARHVHASSGEFEEVLASALAEVGKTCREGGAHEKQWLHCLAVTGLLLENITSLDVLAGRAIEPEEIIHSLLLPAVKHLHPEVQRAGVRCLGMFCSLERTPSPRAVERLRLSFQNLQVRKMALKAMFELVLCHGAAAIDCAAGVEPGLGLPSPHPRPRGHHIPVRFSIEGVQEEHSGLRISGVPILEIFEKCLHREEFEYNEEISNYVDQINGIAAEGFAKVLLQNKRFPDVRLIQERIVVKLLVLYFSPALSSRLKQYLTVFFRTWCSRSAANKRCIAAAFIPVVRKKWPGIHKNRKAGPGGIQEARRHATQVANFLVKLLVSPINSKVNQETPQQTPEREDDGAVVNDEQVSSALEREDSSDEGHETLAVRICAEIRGHGAKRFTDFTMAFKEYICLLCRMIPLLRFSSARQAKIKVLLSLLPRVIDMLPISKKTICKALGEALTRLKRLDETPDTGLTDEELELFLVRMGFHELFEESPSDPSSPEPQSIQRTGGRTKSVAPRSAASTRPTPGRAQVQTARARSRVQTSRTTASTRKNLTSVYESLSDGSESSTICSGSDSGSDSDSF